MSRTRSIVLLALLVSLVPACSAPSTGTLDAGATRDAAHEDDGGADAEVVRDDASADGGSVPADASIADAGGADASMPVCSDTTFDLPYPDAVPGEITDPTPCPACATFGAITIDRSETTARVRGSVTGAGTCRWYLRSPTCGGNSGAFDPGEFTTFDITLPLFCGTNRLQLVCESDAGRTIATRDVDGPACASMRDLQVTLSWGATSYDQELHLVREGGRINDTVDDCTWFTCMSASPDWGVLGDATDDPRKDVDNTSTFGPENIYLASAAAGRYDVMVEYWGSGTADAPEVAITIDGVTVWRGMHTLAVHDVWHVGTVQFPAGTFTPVDVVTPCAADWTTGTTPGCDLALP